MALSAGRGTPTSQRNRFPLPDLTLVHLLSEVPGTAVFSFPDSCVFSKGVGENEQSQPEVSILDVIGAPLP